VSELVREIGKLFSTREMLVQNEDTVASFSGTVRMMPRG
jgi:hypothetical protein